MHYFARLMIEAPPYWILNELEKLSKERIPESVPSEKYQALLQFSTGIALDLIQAKEIQWDALKKKLKKHPYDRVGRPRSRRNLISEKKQNGRPRIYTEEVLIDFAKKVEYRLKLHSGNKPLSSIAAIEGILREIAKELNVRSDRVLRDKKTMA